MTEIENSLQLIYLKSTHYRRTEEGSESVEAVPEEGKVVSKVFVRDKEGRIVNFSRILYENDSFIPNICKDVLKVICDSEAMLTKPIDDEYISEINEIVSQDSYTEISINRYSTGKDTKYLYKVSIDKNIHPYKGVDYITTHAHFANIDKETNESITYLNIEIMLPVEKFRELLPELTEVLM